MHNFESEIQKFSHFGEGTPSAWSPSSAFSNQWCIQGFRESGQFFTLFLSQRGQTMFPIFSYDQTYFCHGPKYAPPLNTPLSPTQKQLTQMGAFR